MNDQRKSLTLLWAMAKNPDKSKNRIRKMAKKDAMLIKLVSTAGTGFYYVKKRNPKRYPNKLAFTKYDPVVRKHVEFKEEKLK